MVEIEIDGSKRKYLTIAELVEKGCITKVLITRRGIKRAPLGRRRIAELVRLGRIPAIRSGMNWLVAVEDAAAFNRQPRNSGRPTDGENG
jgi:hypothetical protein